MVQPARRATGEGADVVCVAIRRQGYQIRVVAGAIP